MDKLDTIIDKIESCMMAQVESGMENIDTDEFGKVADVYKDLMYAKSLKHSTEKMI